MRLQAVMPRVGGEKADSLFHSLISLLKALINFKGIQVVLRLICEK